MSFELNNKPKFQEKLDKKSSTSKRKNIPYLKIQLDSRHLMMKLRQ